MSRFSFRFSNLYGSVYRGGNVCYTSDGSTLLSPVNNRICVLDLVNQHVRTLPVENRKNVACIALGSDDATLLSIDEDGHALLCNFHKGIVVCEFHFKQPVECAKFSPDMQYVAVSHGSHTQVWKTPQLVTQFRPFHLYKTFTGHYDDVVGVDWSSDSLSVLTASRDNTVRAFTLHSVANYVPMTFTGHKSPVLAAFFASETNQLERDTLVFTVSKDGSCFVWEFTPREEWKHKDPTPDDNDSASSSSSSSSGSDSSSSSDADDESGSDSGAASDSSSSTANAARRRPSRKHAAERAKRQKTLDLSEEELKKLPLVAKGSFRIRERYYFKQDGAKVSCVHLHKSNTRNLLVVGFATGVFGLYDLPDFQKLHTLSIGTHRITSIVVNPTGEWLAVASAQLGQLLVWEWQSESYIIKQQGHFFHVGAIEYSPNGQILASGDDSGKLKLWNTSTGFCFITFADHSGPITAVQFSASGNVVFSSSYDGTVRAYDLTRYRNFRTLTPPKPAQLTSLCVDESGEIVCAGALDPFEVYVWSLQTGKLLDVLSGHTAPITDVVFTPITSMLASASWDGDVILYDVFTGKGAVDTLQGSSDLLALAFRPDGKELCTSALDGNLYFWDVYNGSLKMSIDGRRDARGGRRENDARASENSSHSLAFNSVCYSADGTCIIAGGNSRFVCIYEISQKILLKRFSISANLSLDGVLDKLNSKYMTSAGSVKLIDDSDSGSDVEDRKDPSLPGVRKGDLSSRRTKLAVGVKSVRFAPTGSQWAAATSEGVVVFALDNDMSFHPGLDLDIDVTPEAAKACVQKREFSKALAVALCLEDEALVKQVIEATPVEEVHAVVRSVSQSRVYPLLRVLADMLQTSPHLHFYLVWTQKCLTVHGSYLQRPQNRRGAVLRSLQKQLTGHFKTMSGLAESNQHMVRFLSNSVDTKRATTVVDAMEIDEEEPQSNNSRKRKHK
jgi:periodic tryptophan protein 2